LQHLKKGQTETDAKHRETKVFNGLIGRGRMKGQAIRKGGWRRFRQEKYGIDEGGTGGYERELRFDREKREPETRGMGGLLNKKAAAARDCRMNGILEDVEGRGGGGGPAGQRGRTDKEEAHVIA